MKEIERAVERFMQEGGWDKDKPKEIEEIKKRYPNKCLCKDSVTIRYPTISCPICGIQVYRDIQVILSSLETAQIYIEQLRGALGYSVSGNIRENPEIKNGIAEALQQQLEKEEEQSDYFCLKLNQLADELVKEKERADRETISVNELSLANQELEERVKELEICKDEATRRVIDMTKEKRELEKRLEASKLYTDIGRMIK